MSLFKRRRFPVEIILLCVRWYCKCGISYRDLAEMMQERDVAVYPVLLSGGETTVSMRGQGRAQHRFFG